MTGMLGPLLGSMADGPDGPDEPATAPEPPEATDAGHTNGNADSEAVSEADAVAHDRAPARRPLPAGALSVADEILGRTRPTPRRPDVAVRVGDTVHELGDRPIVFGRRPGRDVVVVADGRVSRRHAAVEQELGTPVVRDVGSTNGTQVRRDGTTIVVGSSPVPLRVGDTLLTIDGLVLGTIVATSIGNDS